MNNLFSKKQKLKYFLPMIIGFIYSILLKNLIKKKIILVGGNSGEFFDDNSKAIYLYLKDNPDYSVYWCQREDKIYDKAIEKYTIIGSVLTYFRYFSADIVFFSHSISTDIAPMATKLKFKQPFRVFLTHGVDGLKKHKGAKYEYIDFCTCINELEFSIKNSDWGIDAKKLKVVGMARYDYLVPQPKKQIQKILYMPTWREWYYNLSLEEFKETDMFKKILELLNHKKLANILQDKEITLTLKLHPFFKKYLVAFNDINLDNIIISDENISELILESDALITDYSSIAWDFLYLKKPIIFYQFDLEKFLKERGAYISLPDELFGKYSQNPDQIIKYIEEISTLIDEQEMGKYINTFFKYNDRENCRRIFDATNEIKSRKNI